VTSSKKGMCVFHFALLVKCDQLLFHPNENSIGSKLLVLTDAQFNRKPVTVPETQCDGQNHLPFVHQFRAVGGERDIGSGNVQNCFFILPV
jgi:hypothetical protein